MSKRLKQFLTTDIPFARDDANRLLPAMVACMIGFAALLLASGVSLAHAIGAQSRDVAGVVQVEVPEGVSATVIEQTTQLLRRTAGVEEVTVLRDAEVEKLLKPWLGERFSISDLPVPTIIDVQTDTDNGKTRVDTAALEAQLQKLHPGIRVESQGPWVADFAAALGWLQLLVLLVAVLLISCVVGMIVLVARTHLKLHFKAVGLLHMFGATDDYILTQFQWNSAWLAARGALTGVAFAAIIYLAAVIFSGRAESPVIPEIHFSLTHLSVFLFLPLLTALVSLVATRLTVQSMLQNMH
jgi:cell division transport system permease protein